MGNFIDTTNAILKNKHRINFYNPEEIDVSKLYPSGTPSLAETAKDHTIATIKFGDNSSMTLELSELEFKDAQSLSDIIVHGRIVRTTGPKFGLPKVTNVIFNNPATIVFWSDGTKTVVKCGERDQYDPEKGLAMAIAKKSLGNTRDYYNIFNRWLKKANTDN